MMLKLMFAVALCGAVHRIDVASVGRCCSGPYAVGNNHSDILYPGWVSTESEKNVYRLVVEEYRNIIKEQQLQEQQAQADSGGVLAVPAEEVQNFQKLHPDESCSICLTPFYQEDSSENVVVKTTCNHLFHEKCLTEWLENKKLCPLCRKCLGDQNAYQQYQQPVIRMSTNVLIILMGIVEASLSRGENIPRRLFRFYLQR